VTARSSQTLFLYRETGGEEGEADPQTTEQGNPIPGLDVEEEEEITTHTSISKDQTQHQLSERDMQKAK
jgi:hypothetical protein